MLVGGPINIFCIRVSPQLVALPRGDGSAVTPPGPMPPLCPVAPPQSSFSGLVEETQPIRIFVRAREARMRYFYPQNLAVAMFLKFSALETSTHGFAEHVALQLAP